MVTKQNKSENETKFAKSARRMGDKLRYTWYLACHTLSHLPLLAPVGLAAILSHCPLVATDIFADRKRGRRTNILAWMQCRRHAALVEPYTMSMFCPKVEAWFEQIPIRAHETGEVKPATPPEPAG